MNSRWAVLLTCGALVAGATPANAQTQQQDAVALARTLADGFTAIEARRPEARAAVKAWDAGQVRCATPRLRSRGARITFTLLRMQARHYIALRALAPEVEQLAQRLRALPVSDPAIRGGIAEVLRDYRNARAAMDAEPPTLCAIARGVRGNGSIPPGVGDSEDVRSSQRGVTRRSQRLRAARRALLAVEVDTRLARSLDTVFGHATGGLYHAPIDAREHLAPPFAIVTDPAELARLRTEAGQVASTTDTLAAARRPVARQLEEALGRGERCRPALMQAARHRPLRTLGLVTSWIFGEFAAAIAPPAEQFLADVRAVPVSDAALAGVIARASDQLESITAAPRVDICGELRAWRRAGWPRGRVRLPDLGVVEVGASFGLRLERAAMDRALLRRRGVPPAEARALAAPVEFLLTALVTSSGESTRSLQATAWRALR
jgi:hypothetical protein